MTKHRSHGAAFKRQVAEEFIAGGTLHALSKSQVSRLVEEINEGVNAFLSRPVEGEWPYL